MCFTLQKWENNILSYVQHHRVEKRKTNLFLEYKIKTDSRAISYRYYYDYINYLSSRYYIKKYEHLSFNGETSTGIRILFPFKTETYLLCVHVSSYLGANEKSVSLSSIERKISDNYWETIDKYDLSEDCRDLMYRLYEDIVYCEKNFSFERFKVVFNSLKIVPKYLSLFEDLYFERDINVPLIDSCIHVANNEDDKYHRFILENDDEIKWVNKQKETYDTFF